MLNHYRPRETSWTFAQSLNAFTMTSLSPLVEGQQVMDSYGKKCNSRFLLHYGFAIEENVEEDGSCPNEVPIRLKLDMVQHTDAAPAEGGAAAVRGGAAAPDEPMHITLVALTCVDSFVGSSILSCACVFRPRALFFRSLPLAPGSHRLVLLLLPRPRRIRVAAAPSRANATDRPAGSERCAAGGSATRSVLH
jgi:hypothetical protein